MGSDSKTTREAIAQFGVWFFTAVVGFIGYTVWTMSVAVTQLATEVKHLNESSAARRQIEDGLQQQIYVLRVEVGTLKNSVELMRQRFNMEWGGAGSSQGS